MQHGGVWSESVTDKQKGLPRAVLARALLISDATKGSYKKRSAITKDLGNGAAPRGELPGLAGIR